MNETCRAEQEEKIGRLEERIRFIWEDLDPLDDIEDNRFLQATRAELRLERANLERLNAIQ
jgi:hypothetical protein